MKLLSAVVVLAVAAPIWSVDSSRESVVTHEWGTFTSIAGDDGRPVRWAPLSGPGDLPCFVENLGIAGFKERAMGLVRMETPVLYFYSQQPVTLSVRVGFPQGWITEWYPRANRITPSALMGPPSRYSDGEIQWTKVEVLPGHDPVLPASKGASHYFAARETDAAPVRVGSQWEKLIFYRGVGDFSIPLRPVFTPEGRVKITNAGEDTVPLAILFENREGKVGYRIARGVKDVTEVDVPELTASLDDLRTELIGHLVEFGLYRKEAAAMVETWRDSWFEEGMRLFYLVPRSTVDTVLPLDVQPAPASIARVFVGRIELLSPGMRKTIETASAKGDTKRLLKLGRFLGPFVTQMERENPGRPRAAAVHNAFQTPMTGPACVQ